MIDAFAGKKKYKAAARSWMLRYNPALTLGGGRIGNVW